MCVTLPNGIFQTLNPSNTMLHYFWHNVYSCCRESYTASQLRVLVGEHDLSVLEGTESSFAIKQMYMHPYYNTNTKNNDIALIKIQGTFEFNLEVSSVCLPDSDIAAGTDCVTTGWGATRGEYAKVAALLSNFYFPRSQLFLKAACIRVIHMLPIKAFLSVCQTYLNVSESVYPHLILVHINFHRNQ